MALLKPQDVSDEPANQAPKVATFIDYEPFVTRDEVTLVLACPMLAPDTAEVAVMVAAAQSHFNSDLFPAARDWWEPVAE